MSATRSRNKAVLVNGAVSINEATSRVNSRAVFYLNEMFPSVISAGLFSNARLSRGVISQNLLTARRGTDNESGSFPSSSMERSILDYTVPAEIQTLYNERMYFDGVNDRVSWDDVVLEGDFSVELTFLVQAFDTNPFTLRILDPNLFLLSHNRRLQMRIDGNFSIGASVVANELNTLKITRIGSQVTCTLNGVTTVESNSSSDPFTVRGFSSHNGFIQGLGFNIKIDIGNTGTYDHHWEGDGNTNANWLDQIGSKNGTVFGSPALFTGQGFQSFTTLSTNQGSGNNAVQTTAANQPRVVIDGQVQTLGGVPILGDFDGVNDFLRIPYSAAWDVSGNQLSVIAVARVNNLAGAKTVIGDFSSSTNDRSWFLGFSDNKIRVVLNGTGAEAGNYIADVDEAILADTFYAIGFVFNSGALTIYVNGAVASFTVTSGTIPSSLFANTNDKSIGANDPESPSAHLAGKIATANFLPTVIDVPSAMDAINAAYGGAIY